MPSRLEWALLVAYFVSLVAAWAELVSFAPPLIFASAIAGGRVLDTFVEWFDERIYPRCAYCEQTPPSARWLHDCPLSEMEAMEL